MTRSHSFIASILGVFLIHSASAAPINWNPAADTIDPTVVLKSGTLVEAVNASPSASVVTVNGVTFSSTDALLPDGASTGLLSGQQTLDPGLDALLDSVDLGGAATSISVGAGGLVTGQSYVIQAFFTDLRSCCSGRVMTFGDGLGGEVDALASGGAGSFGQFVTGTFVADDANQTLSLSIAGFTDVYFSAYQIRTVGSPPVIGSFTASPPFMAFGGSTTLSWEISNADSAQIDVEVGSVNPVSGSVSVGPLFVTTGYTLTASNSAGSVTAQRFVGVGPQQFEPRIREFLASNDTTLEDADGEFSDWIEIRNSNAFAFDLSGYYLTDDPSNLTQWVFPDGVSLDGDGAIVVFASGVSRGLPELHTNFRLSADGGYLALVDRDGTTVVSEFLDYPSQRTDVSYGEGTGGIGYLSPPTPDEENGLEFFGFVADTEFDVDRGFYEDPITVNITTATPGATVVYTEDGSEPTLSNGTAVPPVDADTPGAASVVISETTGLRAAAFKTGLMETDVDTQTYLFAADIIEQAAMDSDVVDSPDYADEMIPAMRSVRSLSIVTNPANLFDSSTGILSNTGGRGISWERPVSIEFIDPDDEANSFQVEAGLRVHGNGSRGSAKNSLRLLFRGDYGAKKLEYPLFGEDWVAQRFNTIVLRAQNANSWLSNREEDRRSTTYLQDTFAKDTQGAMGHPTAGSTFVHLYLNGQYWGLYNPTERPDGSFGEDHFGGDDADYDAVNRRFSVEVLSGTKVHWDAMIDHADTLLDTQAEYELMEEFIDIDNLIDYMLLHQYMQTRDGPDDFGHNNMRLVRRNNPPGRWRAYVWDMEYSMIDTMGTRDYSYPFPTYSSPRSASRDISDSIAAIYLRLKDNNPEFQLRYADRAYKHLFNDGVLTDANASARFEQRAEEIESAIIGESARWGDHRRVAPYSRDGDWTTERNRLLDEFFPARPDHVISQLRIHGLYPSFDPPAFGQHGGEVPSGFDLPISAPEGTIYYTTDGSDPREIETGNAVGMAYSAPIELAQSATVKARALENGEWSALAEASFFVGAQADASNLVISEIFYKPASGAGDLEFIELENISAGTIELGGVEFVDGVDFVFSDAVVLGPGGRALVVSDLAAFELEYGAGLPIAGEFLNGTGLSNSGERIALVARDGEMIRDFTYDDDLPWPTAADDGGYSLVLVDPASNPDHGSPGSWRSSSLPGGNPALTDSLPYLGGDILAYAFGDEPSLLEVGVEGGRVTFSYTHLLAADDVTIGIEWSTDLASWTLMDGDFSVDGLTSIGDGRQLVSFSPSSTPLDGESRIYVRLVVRSR